MGPHTHPRKPSPARRATWALPASLATLCLVGAGLWPPLGHEPAASASPPASSACTGTIAGLQTSAGTPQVVKVGTALSTPLEAEVIDTAGCPVANVDVTFVAPAIGAGATFAGGAVSATVPSGADGIATAPTLTANGVSGTYNVGASTPGGLVANFQVTNTTSGVASSITIASGNEQAATVGATFASPLVVSVMDAHGTPVAGVTVNFSIVTANGAGATFVGGGPSANAETGTSGQATSPMLVAGTTAGTFSVTATASGAGAPAIFSLTAAAAAPALITPGAGSSQSAPLGTDFPIPLAVTVTDSDGNPVVGATVTFTAPGKGPSGIFGLSGAQATVSTSSSGIAMAAPLTANSMAGGYIITARVAGLGTVATFALVNSARTTASAPGAAGTYWLATSAGQVLASGNAAKYGALKIRAPAGPVVAMASTPDGKGYWLLDHHGGVFAFGDAGSYGSLAGHRPVASLVGMAATPDGHGYWLVARNGAVYAFGDAHYYGPGTAAHFKAPVVGMVSTPDGGGYWLVTSDGGVMAYGDAGFHGSAATLHLREHIVGVAVSPGGKGYWLVASDGGVFSFGDAVFYGSARGLSRSPVSALVATPDGAGYWVVTANGTVAGFGDAGAQGSQVLTKGTVVAGAA